MRRSRRIAARQTAAMRTIATAAGSGTPSTRILSMRVPRLRRCRQVSSADRLWLALTNGVLTPVKTATNGIRAVTCLGVHCHGLAAEVENRAHREPRILRQHVRRTKVLRRETLAGRHPFGDAGVSRGIIVFDAEIGRDELAAAGLKNPTHRPRKCADAARIGGRIENVHRHDELLTGAKARVRNGSIIARRTIILAPRRGKLIRPLTANHLRAAIADRRPSGQRVDRRCPPFLPGSLR